MIKNIGLSYYIIFSIFLFFLLKSLYERNSITLKCIISDVNGERYCVRDRKELKQAADLLAMVSENCNKLVHYLRNKYPNDKDVLRLSERFNPRAISETLPTSEYTAYSENKGEKLAFCLNENKYMDGRESKLIDINTLTFVALHELAHIMTLVEGHKLVFWENFKFLLINAVDIEIYTPIDYKNNNKEYCGMNLTDNPYFNLESSKIVVE